MTRKKVKLAYITNDSARKATFKKRKKGLIKKITELSTLCDIDACVIIYSPYDAQPEVYPSPLGLQQVLARFKKMPEMEQSKKMVNQECFLRQRIAKANEQLKKQRKDNREKEITRLMFQSLTGAKGLQGLSILDLNDLGWLIEQNLKEINRKMERIGGRQMHESKPRPGILAMHAAEKKARSDVEAEIRAPPGFEAKPQWFMDLMNQAHEQQQHVGFGAGGEELMLPHFGDQNNGHWSNGFYH
ncbi:Agamous-like MADS-box protein AGL80 [Morus notabilis]|uniref:Agamous-like MADS-box protein AGL80 n=1 Tax=Morus notabilis TaxID=981085 RepID=W9R845_9ROSA|nr:agamous-like MADS-box protein AGL80 [Morus notabilis]EXB57549.1 Agamous-like MADS-box protein AGL80 [Morus notabilis]